jgi:hypothetical protein
MHDIKSITEKLLPVFESHKDEENIEVEIRLGKHNGSLFDTNVGKETFERILDGLKRVQRLGKHKNNNFGELLQRCQ